MIVQKIKLICINDNLYFENELKDEPENSPKIYIKTRLTKGKVYKGYKTSYGYSVYNDQMVYEAFVKERFIELRDFNLNNILE